MLAGIHNHLSEKIINILARTPSLSEAMIEQALKETGVSATTQGIYQCLRTLQRDGVAVKENHEYSLRLAWIMEMSAMVKDMERVYLNTSYSEHILPQSESEKMVWHFSNLMTMCDFWSQILIAMAEVSRTKIALNYSPHVWFDVVVADKEDQFAHRYLSLIKYEYSVVGSRSFLDKYCETTRRIPKNEIYYFAAPDEYIEKERSTYIDVIDDLVLTIKIDKHTTDMLEAIYENVTNPAHVDRRKIAELLTTNTHSKMMLQLDQKKSKTYYRKFTQLFGPLENGRD